MIAGIVVLVVTAGLVWAFWPKPVLVDTSEIAKQTIQIAVEEEGKSRVREVYTISAPITGQMLRLNLHAGDSVEEGQTIVARLKPVSPALLDARSRRVAEAQREAATAAVDLASAQLRQAGAQLRFTEEDLKRAEQLLNKGTISQRIYDKALLDVDAAKAVLESANAQLLVRKREQDSAIAALSDENGNMAQCCVDLRSPVNGKLLRVLTESEQVVAAGTPLLEIGDPEDIEIVSDVLSRDAVRLTIGARATISDWGGEPLAAEVREIDPAATTKISALGIEEQRVAIILEFTGDKARLAPLGHGFRVTARIIVSESKDRPAVPIGALFRLGGDWAVYIADNGSARLQRMKIGAMDSRFAEVLEGPKEGEHVILYPNDRLQDGGRIEETIVAAAK